MKVPLEKITFTISIKSGFAFDKKRGLEYILSKPLLKF
jgi:hypothetical protein